MKATKNKKAPEPPPRLPATRASRESVACGILWFASYSRENRHLVWFLLRLGIMPDVPTTMLQPPRVNGHGVFRALLDCVGLPACYLAGVLYESCPAAIADSDEASPSPQAHKGGADRPWGVVMPRMNPDAMDDAGLSDALRGRRYLVASHPPSLRRQRFGAAVLARVPGSGFCEWVSRDGRTANWLETDPAAGPDSPWPYLPTFRVFEETPATEEAEQ